MKLLEEQLLEEIEKITSISEIVDAAKYLNENYNLFSTDPILWDHLKVAFNYKYEALFNRYSNQIIANKLINLILLTYYPSERVIKHALVDFLKTNQDTILFEMPILSSRVDIGRINGNSYAYEIKTELDSLNRIEKQINDYSQVYEYIILVIAPLFLKEVLDLVPDYCGIWVYNHDKKSKKITFSKKRSPRKSPFLNSSSQLNSLSQYSLYSILKSKNIKNIPLNKEDKIKLIKGLYKPRTINTKFKALTKQAYKNNWNFIVENYSSILPIDVQTFFNNPIEPNLVYFK